MSPPSTAAAAAPTAVALSVALRPAAIVVVIAMGVIATRRERIGRSQRAAVVLATVWRAAAIVCAAGALLALAAADGVEVAVFGLFELALLALGFGGFLCCSLKPMH